MSYTSPFVPQVLPKALDASCGAYKLREQLQEKIMFRSESGRWSSVREALKVLRLGSAIEGMWITPEELQTTLRDRLGLTVPDGPYLRLLSGARHDKHGRIHFGDFVNAIASADFTRRLWVDESEERTREARRRYQLPTTKLGFYEHTLPKYVIKDVDELQAVLGRTIERKCGSNGIQRLSTKLFPRQNKKSFTRAEFHDAITTKMGFLCDRATSDALFDRFDTDKSGTVGQFEFVRGVLPPDYSSKQWTAYSEEAAVKNLDKKNRSMKAWVAEQPKPFRVLPQTRAVQGGTARTTDGRQSDEDGSRTEGFGDDDSSEPSSGPRRMPRIPVGKVVPSIDVNRGKPIRSPRARPLPEILRDMKVGAAPPVSSQPPAPPDPALPSQLAAEFQTETGSIATLNRFLRHTWNVKPNTPVPRAIGLSRFKRGLPRLNVVEQRDLRVLADKYMDKQKGVIRLAQVRDPPSVARGTCAHSQHPPPPPTVNSRPGRDEDEQRAQRVVRLAGGKQPRAVEPAP